MGDLKPKPLFQFSDSLKRGLLFSRFIKSFHYPNLDDRLPRHTESFGFLIQSMNHPFGEIQIELGVENLGPLVFQ